LLQIELGWFHAPRIKIIKKYINKTGIFTDFLLIFVSEYLLFGFKISILMETKNVYGNIFFLHIKSLDNGAKASNSIIAGTKFVFLFIPAWRNKKR
jgi:hypothetical protein